MLYAGYQLSHILCPTTLIAASHRSTESDFATLNRYLDFRCIDHPVIAETIGNVLTYPVVGTSIPLRSPPAMGRLFIAPEPRRNSIGRPLYETTIVVTGISLIIAAAVFRPVSFEGRARPVVLGVLALAVTAGTAAAAFAISGDTRATISSPPNLPR